MLGCERDVEPGMHASEVMDKSLRPARCYALDCDSFSQSRGGKDQNRSAVESIRGGDCNAELLPVCGKRRCNLSFRCLDGEF